MKAVDRTAEPEGATGTAATVTAAEARPRCLSLRSEAQERASADSSGLSRKGQRTAGSRGLTTRRRAGAGAESPHIRRDSVVLVILFQGEVAASASAQLVLDDVDVAMPAGGDSYHEGWWLTTSG